MHLHFFLLLFSSGVSSYFLPLKEPLLLQNKTKYTLIHEMLCLLKAENGCINEKFSKPLQIENQGCAHHNIKTFIKEVQKLSKHKCMQILEKDMEMLEKKCSILKKSSHQQTCPNMKNTTFSQFKESLEGFLIWVNHMQNCSSITRSGSGLYPGGACVCPDVWKHSKCLL